MFSIGWPQLHLDRTQRTLPSHRDARGLGRSEDAARGSGALDGNWAVTFSRYKHIIQYHFISYYHINHNDIHISNYSLIVLYLSYYGIFCVRNDSCNCNEFKYSDNNSVRHVWKIHIILTTCQSINVLQVHMECHGTGTPLGDPIEIGGLKSINGSRQGVTGQNCCYGFFSHSWLFRSKATKSVAKKTDQFPSDQLSQQGSPCQP